MIRKGQWTGRYSFSNEKVTKIRGFDHTRFDMEILHADGDTFTGTIRDDQATGGMEGIGKIRGTSKGNTIEFVKQMPVMTVLVNGSKRTFPRKHRPIYYSGQFSPDKNTVSGSWRFKFGFIWFGWIPVPAVPLKGTWTMEFSEHLG